MITSNWNEYNPSGLVPKFIVNRYDDSKSHRFYYFMDGGIRKSGAGITTWLDKVMPESDFLTEWKLKFSNDWRHVLNLTANYGTMLHACFAHIIINREQPPQEMIDVAIDHIRGLQKYSPKISTNMIYKDLICFKRFQEEFNVKPILVEALLPVSYRDKYYCLTLDLLCEIDYVEKERVEVEDGVYVRGAKRGQPKFKTEVRETVKKIYAIVDFKSNAFQKDQKTFFDAHKYQLVGGAKAVEQNFGIVVDKVFNWSPNNWRSDVGDYTLHEWKLTGKDYRIFHLYEQLAYEHGHFEPHGKIEDFDLKQESYKDMYKSYSYMDYIEKLDADNGDANG